MDRYPSMRAEGGLHPGVACTIEQVDSALTLDFVRLDRRGLMPPLAPYIRGQSGHLVVTQFILEPLHRLPGSKRRGQTAIGMCSVKNDIDERGRIGRLDDRANASRLIEAHLPAAREFGLVDQLVTAYTIQAKLHVAEGDVVRAVATLQDGIRFSEERQLDRLRRGLQGEKVRLFSALGTPTTLEEIASPPSSRTHAKDSDTEIHDAAKARAILSNSRHTEVLRLANSWISFCTRNLAVRTLTRWQLIRTHALLLSGDTQNARRSLREALTGAARGGFLRKIVDSAPPVRTLLLESYQAQSAQNNEIDVFVKKAIDIISKNRGTSSSVTAQRLDDADTLGAALTSKEREILTLVAGGLRTREIGLPKNDELSALLMFNIGVEAGQIAFVLAIVAVGVMMRKASSSPASGNHTWTTALSKEKTRILAAYAGGALAAFWFVERAWEGLSPLTTVG